MPRLLLSDTDSASPEPFDVAQFHASVARGDPCVLVVDDVHLTGPPDRQRLLELVLQRLRSPSGRPRPGPAVVAGAKLADCSRAWSGILADLRSHRTGVVLGEAIGAEREVFGVRVPRRPDAPAPPGRGHLVVGSEVHALQAVHIRPGDPVPLAGARDSGSRLDVTA